jgi:hypothetical protein
LPVGPVDRRQAPPAWAHAPGDAPLRHDCPAVGLLSCRLGGLAELPTWWRSARMSAMYASNAPPVESYLAAFGQREKAARGRRTVNRRRRLPVWMPPDSLPTRRR